MTKSTATYWNTLDPANRERWTPVRGLEQMAEELTLSIDQATGEYTRLTRFLPGADTTAFGGKVHPYPEEVFIVSGRLYDEAFDIWLEPGHYASRPPGELHGPFKTDGGCVVLEVSFPHRIADSTVDASLQHQGWKNEVNRVRVHRSNLFSWLFWRQ
ncbi:MAG: cupin domain-containing protein [Leptospirales bacterium]